MAMGRGKGFVPVEVIQSKIVVVRDERVMLDKDLAELYGVETKQLKRAVRRNLHRFPPDFIFYLTRKEVNDLRCHFGTLSWGEGENAQGRLPSRAWRCCRER
jgi:hypothetical protein